MSNSRLAAILALDVVGYSRMMQVYGHELVSTLNTIFKKVVQPATQETGGRIVKLLGDGAIVEFSGAASALRCAVEVQRSMRSADPPYSFPEQIRIRAGLHAGDVVVEGDDIFGDGVNIAARLEAAAQPGGILLSRTFRDLLGSGVPSKLLGEGLRSFKGIENPIEVFSVDFTDTEVVKRRESLLREQEVRFCLTDDETSLAWTKNGDGPPIVQAPA